ncbi:hypothetical protein AB6O49_20020 [Streptomyces sp. SBR177]
MRLTRRCGRMSGARAVVEAGGRKRVSARAAARVSAAVITSALLVSCSGSEQKAVPKLPERICWGAFAGGDVSPLLPGGDKVEFDVDGAYFSLTKDHDSVTCNLYVDGNTYFLASADLRKFETSIDWTSIDPAQPKPLDAGDKGIVWDSGAAAYFTCEPAKDLNTPGKYVELTLSTHYPPARSKGPSVLAPLMKQFVAFAQRELKCGASARTPQVSES